MHQAGTIGVVDALNHVLLLGAGIAAISAVASLVLIRQRDFVQHDGPPAAG